MLDSIEDQFKDFRRKLHESFPNAGDALLSLIDAIAGNRDAKSPTALSLSPLFSRGYSSLHDAVDKFSSGNDGTDSQRIKDRKNRLRILAEFIPRPKERHFFLVGTDVTPAPRRFARTLPDRHITYSPNAAPGNKPIVVGHQYSTLAVLPERGKKDPPWAIPLHIERVPSHLTGNDLAIWQIEELMFDDQLPFPTTLTVNVLDSAYGVASYLGRVGDIENLINVVRSRGNRVFYRIPEPQSGPRGKGRPKWYGPKFNMKDPGTWGAPDQTVEHLYRRRSGKRCTVKIEVWNDLLMRGKRGIRMHHHPFTLIRSQQYDESGNLLFKRPLWLIVLGKRRSELSPVDVWICYIQRYDLEHFFRFGKNRLLLSSNQTPVLEHEENWWNIVGLSYFMLWMASPLAVSCP
ncbi:transposase, partial [Magnetococcales bacterium HHB-1]